MGYSGMWEVPLQEQKFALPQQNLIPQPLDYGASSLRLTDGLWLDCPKMLRLL